MLDSRRPLEALYPYQLVGAEWLAKMPQAFLADDMGLGKSAQAIHAADIRVAWDILVICPAAVRVNWQREFEKFSPLSRPCCLLDGSEASLPSNGVAITSYDLLVAPSASNALDIFEDAPTDANKARVASTRALARKRKAFLAALKTRAWDLIIIDECHYLKERTASRTVAIYDGNQGLIASAAAVWRLSGTPCPNNAGEIWTHLRSAGYSQAYWDFVYMFCTGFTDDYNDFTITGIKNAPQLKAILAKFILRRTKEEVLPELPPLIFEEVVVGRGQVDLSDPIFDDARAGQGPAAFLRALLHMEEDLATLPDEELLRVLERDTPALVTLRRFIAMAKLASVLDIIEDELENGQLEKIVIFGIHQCVVEAAALRLARFGAVLFYGKTSATLRQKNIDRFQTDPTCRVFVGNIGAAGVGITLTAASEEAFIEQDWVPANNVQAAARCHRIGQTRAVRARVFSLVGSVDERVQNTLCRKERELAKVF